MLSHGPIINAFHALSAALLLLVCASSYSNSLEVPFTFDDGPNIHQNEAIRITRLDAPSLFHASFESRAPRPVAYLSFALNYYFGEYQVRGYHMVNIFIHWLSGILVYWLASDLFRRQRLLQGGVVLPGHSLSSFFPALLAAGIFVAHPIQTQAVTYIVQRMSSMATLFYLLALVLYLCGRERVGIVRSLNWLGTGVCWLLAMGSKQTAVTLPILILLYEWYFFQNLSLDWVKRRLPYLAAVALGLVCSAVLFLVLTETAFEYSNRDFSLVERLLTQSRVLMQYLGLLVLPLPSRLNLSHHVPVSHSLLDPLTTLFSILALLFIFLIAIRTARSQRLLSFCILWFFINLAIESSVVAIELMFEHRLYLPMFAFSVLVGEGFRVLAAKQGIWLWGVAAGLVLALGLGTYERNKAWRDDLTLWSDVVSKSPDDFRAHSNLGRAYKDLGDLNAGITHLNRSIELNDNFFPPRWDLADIALKQGDAGEAIGQLRGALAVDAHSRLAEPYFAKAHLQISDLLVAAGEWSEARAHAEKAVVLSPNRARAMMRLGWILKADPNRSAADLERVVELAERADELTEHAAPRALDMLAIAYKATGRYKEAAAVVADMLEIEIAAGGGREGLLRARLKRYEAAGDAASEPVSLKPSSTELEGIR